MLDLLSDNIKKKLPNLTLAGCLSCNQKKANMPIKEFAEQINIKLEDLPITGDPIIDNTDLPKSIRQIRKEVFKKIADKESNGPTINHKVGKKELEAYFNEVLPEYDEERVYASDIKKIVQWYNLLQKNGITDFTEKETDASEEE